MPVNNTWLFICGQSEVKHFVSSRCRRIYMIGKSSVRRRSMVMNPLSPRFRKEKILSQYTRVALLCDRACRWIWFLGDQVIGFYLLRDSGNLMLVKSNSSE